MAPIVHIIDPDPDTVIVLKNPCTIFALWTPEQGHYLDRWIGVGSSKSKKDKKKAKKASKAPRPPPSPPPPELLSPERLEDSSMFALDDGSTAPAEASSATQPTPPPIAPEEPGEPEEESIHYHVSSRHLMLASSTFKRMLAQDGFAESVRNEVDGLYHIVAHDWDPEAFLIVMRIVHGRNKQVPREVTLEMLAKIAVLEDYYNFGETLDVFIEVWIWELTKRSLPQIHCRDLVLWIWIAWVFDVEEQFTNATATSIRQITEPFRTLDLPIPSIVSDAIDTRRYLAIESLIEGLYKRLEMYRSTDYTCRYSGDSHMSFQCGSVLLGSLMKELYRLGLDQPRPEIPFSGLSFSVLCGQVQNMKSTEWYHARNDYHPCNLKTALGDLTTDVSGTIIDLSLEELKHR